jgi:hypothetical protein
MYLSDYYLREDRRRVMGVKTFERLLSWYAGGKVHESYERASQLLDALRRAGFARATAHIAGDFAPNLGVAVPERSAYVRVIEARCQ